VVFLPGDDGLSFLVGRRLWDCCIAGVGRLRVLVIRARVLVCGDGRRWKFGNQQG